MTLTETERRDLAKEVLPLLLLTSEGLEAIDQALHALSEEEPDAILEQARRRNRKMSEQTIATVISETLQAARATSCS